uniref:Uncharacterized protein n=1 Tax=Arundo donax TaxID=35708 RepID=A0A0A8XSZ9_ARUDO
MKCALVVCFSLGTPNDKSELFTCLAEQSVANYARWCMLNCWCC